MTCGRCEEGRFAPKMMLLENFLSFPDLLKRKCSTFPQYDQKELCEDTRGWRVDSKNIIVGPGIDEGLK